jgi:hypothetical protein
MPEACQVRWPVLHTALALRHSGCRLWRWQLQRWPAITTTIHCNSPQQHIENQTRHVQGNHRNSITLDNTRSITTQAKMASLMRSGMPSSEPGYSFAQAPHTAAGGPRQHGFYP